MTQEVQTEDEGERNILEEAEFKEVRLVPEHILNPSGSGRVDRGLNVKLLKCACMPAPRDGTCFPSGHY